MTRIWNGRSFIVIASALLMGGCEGVAQGKEIYNEAGSWALTSPGDISLANFRPYTATYERTYIQGLGAGAGEERTDFLRVTANEGGWDGQKSVIVTIHESANEDFADTAARSWFYMLNPETLALQHWMGPVSGTATDYNVIRVFEDRILTTAIRSDLGEASQQELPLPGSVFGLQHPYVLGSLPLTEGLNVRIGPFYSEASHVIHEQPVRVLNQESMTDGGGTAWNAWVVEGTDNRAVSSTRVTRWHVVNEPPYLLQRSYHDTVSGEEGWTTRLVDFRYFGN